MYNFDKTGQALGKILGQMVLIVVHDPDVFLKEPGNREWCSSIECIGLHQAVPPFIIFKAKEINLNWNVQVPKATKNWHFCTRSKGWSNSELAYLWIQHYEKHTRPKKHPEQWRLLLCNGDSSHHSAGFIAYCLDHKIACFHIPPHSSHATQPLDVGCFGPLKHYYSEAVTKACATGLANVSKQ